MMKLNNAEALDREVELAGVDSGAGDGVKLAATGPGNGVIVGLCGLDPDAMLDLDALAHSLGCCTKTIERAVKRRELPPGTRFCGRRMWLAGRVRAWIAERAEQGEKDMVREIARLRSLRT